MTRFAVAKVLLAGAGMLLLSGFADQQVPPTSAKKQARLDQALSGRSPGQPIRCVSDELRRGHRLFGGRQILFGAPGDPVIYRNEPPGGCAGLGPSRGLRFRSKGQLCSGDRVDVVDVQTGISYRSCRLGDFIPYRLP